MLRVTHAQTVTGPLRLADIDDGLPNKTAYRLTGNPKAYDRDGYANASKQGVYIPYNKSGSTTIAGYLDLRETDEVTLSAKNGNIAKLVTAGLVTVTSFLITDLATPNVTSNARNSPSAGKLTVNGTGFLSLAPEVTAVALAGAGVGTVNLTFTQIALLGTVSDTQFVIDSTLIPGLAASDTVRVTADTRVGNLFTLT